MPDVEISADASVRRLNALRDAVGALDAAREWPPGAALYLKKAVEAVEASSPGVSEAVSPLLSPDAHWLAESLGFGNPRALADALKEADR
jgi:hypothetical protein